MVLIETLWNVNFVVAVFIERHFIVLIETLWNVNIAKASIKKSGALVLIETLWNVNTDIEDALRLQKQY